MRKANSKPAKNTAPAVEKLVFDGMIKSRTTKQTEIDFAAIAKARGKKVPELARELFNDFIAREKAITAKAA